MLTSTNDFRIWSRTMFQALQNNNPLLLSTNVCLGFRFIRFRLWCTCRSSIIAVTITTAGDRGAGDRVASTSARGLLDLSRLPTKTNMLFLNLNLFQILQICVKTYI